MILEILDVDTKKIENCATPRIQWLNVTVSRMEEANPLRLTFYTVLTRRDGKQKHCSKSVSVVEAALVQRLREEVKVGDQIRVCLETNWASDDIPTVLKDFCPLPLLTRDTKEIGQ